MEASCLLAIARDVAIEINGFRSTDTLLGLLPRVPVFSSIIACYITPTGGFTKATTNFDDIIERRFYFPPALESFDQMCWIVSSIFK